MAPISKIHVEIKTGDMDNAGTDGNVYLGICGREFYLDRDDIDDFERGSRRVYILGGDGANTQNKGENNPENPQLHTTNLPDGVEELPLYIRFEPSGGSPAWNLEYVVVNVFVGNNKSNEYNRNFGRNGLWLGQKSGKFCYFNKGLGST